MRISNSALNAFCIHLAKGEKLVTITNDDGEPIADEIYSTDGKHDVWKGTPKHCSRFRGLHQRTEVTFPINYAPTAEFQNESWVSRARGIFTKSEIREHIGPLGERCYGSNLDLDKRTVLNHARVEAENRERMVYIARQEVDNALAWQWEDHVRELARQEARTLIDHALAPYLQRVESKIPTAEELISSNMWFAPFNTRVLVWKQRDEQPIIAKCMSGGFWVTDNGLSLGFLPVYWMKLPTPTEKA